MDGSARDGEGFQGGAVVAERTQRGMCRRTARAVMAVQTTTSSSRSADCARPLEDRDGDDARAAAQTACLRPWMREFREAGSFGHTRVHVPRYTGAIHIGCVSALRSYFALLASATRYPYGSTICAGDAGELAASGAGCDDATCPGGSAATFFPGASLRALGGRVLAAFFEHRDSRAAIFPRYSTFRAKYSPVLFLTSVCVHSS
ncbi:hypothetical protein C8R47DRAFT_1085350 [Mycena vitilis]|nr:hypothetical protein C8R47DRAFT_1085350 [Mycena vitilis]